MTPFDVCICNETCYQHEKTIEVLDEGEAESENAIEAGMR